MVESCPDHADGEDGEGDVEETANLPSTLVDLGRGWRLRMVV
jgi:hypothetical protein